MRSSNSIFVMMAFFFGLLFGMALPITVYAQAPTSPVLTQIETQRGRRYSLQLAQASAGVTAAKKRVADLGTAATQTQKDEAKDRLAAAQRRVSEVQSLLSNWEASVLQDHQADPKIYKVNWDRGLIVKR